MIDEDDVWSNWWNENWQGKPKYSEKTYPSATLSTTKSHMTNPVSNPGPQWWDEDLHNLYSSPSIIIMIKSRRMRWDG
jgi:hypothetical protein